MFQSKPILSQDIWRSDRDIVASTSRRDVALHYERARSIFRHSGLSQQDIENLTPKFWDFQFDCNGVIAARDMTAFIIVAIQLLNFDICGGFMLTEADHGLDARNLETTATLLPDGSYDLHTPHVGASKAMPLTTPYCGMPRIAIVFARLLVDGKSHGVKPFLVCLSDACGMRPGVTSRILPTRPGTKPLDHSLTAFNHVDLPFSALLGSSSEPENDRLDFLRQIWRVSAGTLSLSIMGISAIKVGTRIAAVYIERRTITTPNKPIPKEIMSFNTQQRPIIEGWVQGKVLHAFARWTIGICRNLSDATRHALATISKATVMKASQILRPLTERFYVRAPGRETEAPTSAQQIVTLGATRGQVNARYEITTRNDQGV
ncbi:peroxisomal acyl-coenzyme A oxidase 3 [Fusarium mundagurra]|uniref:Peroxisomal acyl-coenzyme A oxidase 3 n=1 Tax=Fusarium mundagurra TaxID=1567541 RepID=A0A8H5XMW5_9HYPO|nr:peroxisomal acyl-coenzyme A oxidase 3 [Fusarium mundagurra]